MDYDPESEEGPAEERENPAALILMKPTTFDDIFDIIGHNGKQQRIYYCLLSYTIIVAGMHIMTPVFTHYEPELDVMDSLTSVGCKNESTVLKFSKTEMASTVVTEYQLYCSRGNLAQIPVSVFFCGQMTSTFLSGIIADNYGRRLPIAVFGAIACIASFISSLSVNFKIYTVSRFFIAFVQPMILNSVVYIMEIIGPKYRDKAGIGCGATFALGQLVLSPIALLTKDWRTFQLWLSIATAPCILVYFLIPESPRYLISKDMTSMSLDVLKKIGRANGKSDYKLEKLHPLVSELSKSQGCETTRRNPLDLFRDTRMAWVTVKNSVIFAVIVIGFYGVTLNTSKMKGSLWINNIISALAELVSCATITPYVADRYSYRTTLSWCCGLGSLFFTASWLAIQVTDGTVDWRVIASLSFVAKFFVAAAYSLEYNFTVTLFPTDLRSNAVSVSSGVARMVSMGIGPLMVLDRFINVSLGTDQSILLILAFVVSCSIGIIRSMPEPFGIPLIHSMADASQLYGKESRKK